MRKVALLVIAIALVSFGANAQDTFKKGTNTLKLGLGFNENGKPIGLAYERGIKDGLFGVEKLNLGVGVYAGYFGYNNSITNYGTTVKTNINTLAPGVSGYLHYEFINKLDAYVGLSLGASAQVSQVSGDNVDISPDFVVKFAWGLAGGLRYEITPKWGAFIEGGKGTGSATIGVAYKF
ncbi:MAG TPA: hypothetical protein DCQ31_17855 [Bacteroidales bacterium]|nr:hypothetical protein [Bacteroidales bacterium]